ncbi:hypothetical protein [Anaerorhabdus furcosa]|uniref:Uncharacterized protein n=1 Tax=Anaerorhabdus furcosa TaxID=118967 RepID=A0A1T4M3E6_9FIRM|nr:hypothetical protein [Anaerorhabdus furcosa]SJZ61483.1 hypothetical protein SAMN02745191_1172 [Anaerorhabdus furcosa]
MSKIFRLILISCFLVSCTTKKEPINTNPIETAVPSTLPAPTTTPSPKPTPSATSIIPPDLINNEKSVFWCPTGEYYGVADETVGVGLGLILTNDGFFTVTYDSAGGDYYYGRYEQIEANLFSYYGEVLTNHELERCQGEGCFIMPDLNDTTIDGYLRLVENKMYFIPHQINYEELVNYEDDKPCIFYTN